tara:strand:- start:1270 stop:1692 length:423 start_codon:yes stop_codon:yes gene_type:complete
MEYEILGIPENSPLSTVKDAINKIRLQHHPDKVSHIEKERATIILLHAESAYKRIKNLHRVSQSINHVLSSNIYPFRSTLINPLHTQELNVLSRLSNMTNIELNDITSNRSSINTATYNFKTVNGKVIEEHGTINGQDIF